MMSDGLLTGNCGRRDGPRPRIDSEERSSVFDSNNLSVQNIDRYGRVSAAEKEIQRVVASDKVATGLHGNEGRAPSPDHRRSAVHGEPSIAECIELQAAGRYPDAGGGLRGPLRFLPSSRSDVPRGEDALRLLFVLLRTRGACPPPPKRRLTHAQSIRADGRPLGYPPCGAWIPK
jgi:hypothetical protein